MFNIEVRLSVAGRQVSVDGFVQALLAEVRNAVRNEGKGFSQVRTPVGEFPPRGHVEERKGPRPLSVGINDAARMLGVSPATIRMYVARRWIRSVRIGRRVLIPMEVLERAIVEGLKRAG